MEEVIGTISDILKRNQVRYAIIGGIAVLAWGKPRTTWDVDMIITLSSNNLEKVIEDFASQGFHNPKDAIKRLQRGLTVKLGRGIYSVDLRVASYSLDRQAIVRARSIKGLGINISVASKEDLIVYKLARFDDQDKADIKTVLNRQRKIDFEYIAQASKQLAMEANRPQILKNYSEMISWHCREQ